MPYTTESFNSSLMSPMRKHLETIDAEPWQGYRPAEFHAAMELLREAEAALDKAGVSSYREPDCGLDKKEEDVFGFGSTHKILKAIGALSEQVTGLGRRIQQLEEEGAEIMADQQLELDALKKIDDATTAIATNVTTQAGVVSTIATEVADLVAAQQAEGVPQPIIDQTSALADRLKAAADALNNQTPALQAIATAGASNPVPVPVPTPAPTA